MNYESENNQVRYPSSVFKALVKSNELNANRIAHNKNLKVSENPVSQY